ncbi:MAG: hypothetical protein RJP96_02645 [Algiphilus sp.]|uniref:hypothetical protein n=1 Tax=Algiphilus sp. TaxID=1872431 RepID=UPI0032EC8EBA
MPTPNHRTAEPHKAPAKPVRVYCDPNIPPEATDRERRLREASAHERRQRLFDRKSTFNRTSQEVA